MAAYEHHSEAIYIGRALATVADVSLPARAKPLWALLMRLSENGRKAVYASAGWLAGELGIARSTLYGLRSILCEAGLIRIRERRASYDRSAPSLISVLPLRRVFGLLKVDEWRKRMGECRRRRREAEAEYRKRLAARNEAQGKARKSGCPGNWTQTGTIKDSPSRKSECRLSKALPNMLAALSGVPRQPDRDEKAAAERRAGLGMTDELLARVPDAAERKG